MPSDQVRKLLSRAARMAAALGGSPAERAKRLRKNALHRAQCVLRDAPRLHRVAPQHDGMLLMTLRKCLILRCLAKRGLEGRTTFFQPCGILAQPRSAFRRFAVGGLLTTAAERAGAFR